jgi:hypothetical protein
VHAHDIDSLAAEIAPERMMGRLIIAQHWLGNDRDALGEVVKRLHLIRMETMFLIVATIEGQCLVHIA